MSSHGCSVSPTLYRLSVSENVTHSVCCHTCKAYPITGLRYRCMKCVNLHLCQTCFLTERHTRKHKSSHPVLEHCTQSSWKESLASLAYSARHALLPRQYTHRVAERRRGLIRAESRGEPQTSFTTPDPSPQSAAEDTPPNDRAPPTNPLQLLATPPAVWTRKASKALQTEEEQEEAQPQRIDSVLIKDNRDLQRDKRLLERELQVWRVTVQSEQGSLEDRCSEMEANMDTLRQHNLRLQDMLSQALSMSGTHADVMPHANVIPHADVMPHANVIPHADVMPHANVIPHADVIPHANVIPHADVMPHANVIPHADVMPHANVIPHADVMPHANVIPHADVMPHANVIPHADVMPHANVIPHADVMPHANVIPHADVMPHANVIPHADVIPHANVIPHAKYRPERDIACPVESQSSASSSGSREREREEEEEEREEEGRGGEGRGGRMLHSKDAEE
ncbi:uncharacterized protein LOC115179642 [Salmo trutta]|uniref:uncharacterized protein LOC115179642 n=1 Tax=Salmo trutta TaxID=8032 RepID=UPI0011319273|nr:uncharacterized protein LOC115179642 [Salmo trutta]XP_029597147.1 uncharacterized protein LOC115179642 [Salmo trutta]XP_029597148.1 uncharacterized protein LOC115179642 [Salmo trutta]